MDMVIKRNIFSIIETDVRRCLYCGGVLSFRDDNSFCRKCEKVVHKAAVAANANINRREFERVE